MNQLKKILALVKGEIKCNMGGELVILLMLIIMIICTNIMVTSISEYIGTLIYLMNPSIQNSVQVTGRSMTSDFSSVKALPQVQRGILISCYQESITNIYAVSEEMFSEDLSLFSKENIEAVKNCSNEYTPILATENTRLNVGRRGKLNNGSSYEVVGIIDNEDVIYFVGEFIQFKEFAIAPDRGQFMTETPVTNPYMFIQLSDGIDKAEFEEKCKNLGYAVNDFDPFKKLSADFSNSITASIIGIVTFTISFFGVIINCYLVFCSRRRYYRTLMIVGGKKELYLKSGLVMKAFQVLISVAFSFLGLYITNQIVREDYFNVWGILISAALAILVMAVTWFLLKHWLKAITCLEN